MNLKHVIYIICLLLLYNCDNDNTVVYYTDPYYDNYNNQYTEDCDYTIKLTSYLNQNESGYYELEFLYDYIQTFSTLTVETNSYEIIQKVRFLSNKEIYLENEWINIIDSYSYTDEIDGFAHGVIGVWEQFINDTVKVYAGYTDECNIHHVDSLQIIIK